MKKLNSIQKFFIRILRIDINPTIITTIRLHDPYTGHMRAQGRTTRLADAYIQLLFITGAIEVFDSEAIRNADRLLFDKILNRLILEHQGVRIDIRMNHIYLVDHPRYKMHPRL